MLDESILIIIAILFPILAGTILLFIKEPKSRNSLLLYVSLVFVICGILTVGILLGKEQELYLFSLTEELPILFKPDALGKLFLIIAAVLWFGAGIFSFSYMKHEQREKRYFGFYLITFGVLTGLSCAGNLITMYAFFEFMTLASFPLVLHSQTRASIMASLKYLMYSFFGAYMALFGVFFLCYYESTLSFVPGGALGQGVADHRELMLLAACLMIVGFSVKAGCFPLHAWLPTAHPVAPAPASAVLSGVIVKAGVFAIMRVIFYQFGSDFIKGTYVQYVLLVLSLITVFMGSMLAFREKVLKKRLAYSTVSQLSYILVGIGFLTPESLTGALWHMAAHGVIKCVLFLCAGAIIVRTGITSVEHLKGIGKKMPITIWCFTIASLGLIGIPPTSGFISKWHLAMGALDSGIGVFQYVAPVVLLVSALLTAGYLLPVPIQGFFPGEEYDYGSESKCERDLDMVIPLIVLTALSLLLGIFSKGLTEHFMFLAKSLL